jgi:O-methyltransferase
VLYDTVLLDLPYLYRTPVIAYESHLYDIIDRLLEIALKQTNSVGDIIECGAARCGTSCIIGMHLKANRIKKRIFALDSFGQGFERRELEDERRAGLTTAQMDHFTYNSIEYVKKKIRKLGLDNYVIPVDGWFRETLPTIEGPFSFAIIDCDLERSTNECLEYVWPRLSSGGVMLIDDYANHDYQGVKKALDRFLEERIGRISHIHRANRFEVWK